MQTTTLLAVPPDQGEAHGPTKHEMFIHDLTKLARQASATSENQFADAHHVPIATTALFRATEL